MKNNKFRLEVDTINLLLNSESAVFIAPDKNNKENSIVLFKRSSGQWRFVRFDKQISYAIVGRVEMILSNKTSPKFLFFCFGSYSQIPYLYEVLNDELLN